MPRINIPKKYLKEFVDRGAIAKALGDERGTIKADLAAITKVIQAKLANRAFLEKFANDVISSGVVNVKVKL